MAYLLNNIKLCQKLSKIKDNDFSKFRLETEKILSNFAKLRKVKRYRSVTRKSSRSIGYCKRK